MGNTCFSQAAVLIWSSFCLWFFIFHPIPKLIKLAPFFWSPYLVRLFHTFVRQLGFTFWSHSLFHYRIPWLPNLKKKKKKSTYSSLFFVLQNYLDLGNEIGLYIPSDNITSSVQFSHSVVSDSFRPHEPQHARPPCPSPTPRVHPNPCPSSRWCHLTISSSAIPFSSYPKAFPALGSFPMTALHIRWPKYWSFSFNISPSNEHPGLISLRMDWLDLLAFQGTLKTVL